MQRKKRKRPLETNAHPEKRVGIASFFIGSLGLYIFLISVWAGNSPDIRILLVLLAMIFGGYGVHRRYRPAPTPREKFTLSKLRPRMPKINLGARKKKSDGGPASDDAPPPPPPPPEKKGLFGREFKR